MLRRTLVQAALFGGFTGIWMPSAGGQQKLSKRAADYRDSPSNGLSCAACNQFRAPRSCEIVEGDISPYGWCRFFDLPD